MAGCNNKAVLSWFLAICCGTSAWAGGGQSFDQGIRQDLYHHVLRTFVDPQGLVNYAGLKEKRTVLEQFAGTLASLRPEQIEEQSEAGQIAFWINAYNALTLKVIIDHYPIQAGFFKSFFYPRNSIRQIDGVWTDIRFPVAGKDLTLDDIEHNILRQQFDEPRIHVALVCAALSCPPLRREPYSGTNLDQQLNEQAERFLGRESNFRIAGDTLYLSSIFQWFGEDFLRAQRVPGQFESYTPVEQGILNFIDRHLSEAAKAKLRGKKFSISYVDYDWSLNEQP